VKPIEADAGRIESFFTRCVEEIEDVRDRAAEILTSRERYAEGLFDDKRYVFYKGRVYYTPEDDGNCEAWASGYVPVDGEMIAKIRILEHLCPVMKKTYGDGGFYSAIYINTYDSIMVGYPFGQANTYLKPGLNTATAWVTYWQADEKNNPERRTLTVEPYLDAMGRGYMVSLITPVYSPSGLEATIGMDIRCESIRRRFLDDKDRNLMIVTQSSILVAANGPCERILNMEGPGQHNYLEKASVNRPIPEEYNLSKNPSEGVRGLAARLESGLTDFGVTIQGENFNVLSEAVPVTGWRLVELVGQ